MGNHNSIQLPPDGTGKKILAINHVSGSEQVYSQCIHLSDPNNIDYHQSVDQFGAAYLRFTEGSPIFDSLNRMKTSDSNIVGSNP